MFSLDRTQMQPGALAEEYIKESVMPTVMQGLTHVLVNQPDTPVAELQQFLADNNAQRPVTKVSVDTNTIGPLHFHSREPPMDAAFASGIPKTFSKAGEYPVWSLDLPPQESDLRAVANQLAEDEKVEHVVFVVAGVEDVQCYVDHKPSRATLSSGQWHQSETLLYPESKKASPIASPNPSPPTSPSNKKQQQQTEGDGDEESPLNKTATEGSASEQSPDATGSRPTSVGGPPPEELKAGYFVPFYRNDRFERLENAIIADIQPLSVQETEDTVLHGGIVVEGKSHTILAEPTTHVLKRACLDSGFKTIRTVRFQHPSDVPVTLDVYDRMTELLDSVREPNSAVVIVSADRAKLVQHLSIIATLYFRVQRDIQQLRRTLNALDQQLVADKEVDIDAHHDDVLLRQKQRDETRKHLLKSHAALLEDQDEIEDEAAVQKREEAMVARHNRRVRENQRRLEIMKRANTGAAVKMQSFFRGSLARKKNQSQNQKDRAGVRTTQEIDELLKAGRFPLVELCQATLIDTFGDSQFFSGAPTRTSKKAVKTWHVKVTRIEAIDHADISSEEEEWESHTVEKVGLNIQTASNPLHDVDVVSSVHKADDVKFMYQAFREHAGLPVIQRRAYAMLERMVHNILYAAYLSFHHKKKESEGLLTLKASGMMRVPGSVQSLTHYSEFIKKYNLVFDCLNHPQFSTYFLSNMPPPLSQQRLLVASDSTPSGAFIESLYEGGGVVGQPSTGGGDVPLYNQLHPMTPLFWVPDCLTMDQWSETATGIIKTMPRCKRVLWISSRPDFTVYVNGTPFFSCGRQESHSAGPELPVASTIRNALVVDSALPHQAMQNQLDKEKFFHPISLVPKKVNIFKALKQRAMSVSVHRDLSQDGSPGLQRRSSLASFRSRGGSLPASPLGDLGSGSNRLPPKALGRVGSSDGFGSSTNTDGQAPPLKPVVAFDEKKKRPQTASSDDSELLEKGGFDLGDTTDPNKKQGLELNLGADDDDDETNSKAKGLEPTVSNSVWFGVNYDELEWELAQNLQTAIQSDPDSTLHYHSVSALVVPARSPGPDGIERFKVARINISPASFLKAAIQRQMTRVLRQEKKLRPLRNAPLAAGASMVATKSLRGPPTAGGSSTNSPAEMGFSTSTPPTTNVNLAPGGGTSLNVTNVKIASGNLGAGSIGGKGGRPRSPRGRLQRQASLTNSSAGGDAQENLLSEHQAQLPTNVADVFKTPTQAADEVRNRVRRQVGIENPLVYRRMPMLETFGWEWLSQVDALHILIRSTMNDSGTALAFALSGPDGVFYGTLCALHWAFEYNKLGIAFTEGKLILPAPVTASGLMDVVTPRSVLKSRDQRSFDVTGDTAEMSMSAAKLSQSRGDPLENTMSRQSRQSRRRTEARTPASRMATPAVMAGEGSILGGQSAASKPFTPAAVLTGQESSQILSPNRKLAPNDFGTQLDDGTAASVAPPPTFEPFTTFPCLSRLDKDFPSLDLREAAEALGNIMIQCETHEVLVTPIEENMAAATDVDLTVQQRQDAHVKAVCGLERLTLLLLYQSFLKMQSAILQMAAPGENASFRDFLFSTHPKTLTFLDTLNPWEGRELTQDEMEAMTLAPQAARLRSNQRWRTKEWMPNIG